MPTPKKWISLFAYPYPHFVPLLSFLGLLLHPLSLILVQKTGKKQKKAQFSHNALIINQLYCAIPQKAQQKHNDSTIKAQRMHNESTTKAQ